jgi:hypothetical protein
MYVFSSNCAALQASAVHYSSGKHVKWGSNIELVVPSLAVLADEGWLTTRVILCLPVQGQPVGIACVLFWCLAINGII